MSETCPQCDRPGIFGYRDKQTGEMTWCCTDHRLNQFYADARRANAQAASEPSWPGWHERTTTQ